VVETGVFQGHDARQRVKRGKREGQGPPAAEEDGIILPAVGFTDVLAGLETHGIESFVDARQTHSPHAFAMYTTGGPGITNFVTNCEHTEDFL